jgi:hypothetical protein
MRSLLYSLEIIKIFTSVIWIITIIQICTIITTITELVALAVVVHAQELTCGARLHVQPYLTQCIN